MTTGYLAAAGWEAELREELEGAPGVRIAVEHGRLILADGPPLDAAWAANIWRDPVEIAIGSVGEAAQRLRAIQRNWALHPGAHFRRASLIQARLPHVSAKPLVFPADPPAAALGSWTLLGPDRLLAAARCSSPFPDGAPRFVEDRAGPPNRAYLKLWEALTVLGRRPGPGDLCLDLGASPGGWTWVLASLGARVVAVDKAPLAPAVAALPGVEWRGESAFGLDPKALGPVDWLFCDIACYPERLVRLVERWIAAESAKNMVCTVKFQGKTDFSAIRALHAIRHAELRHLHHNKHELTLFWRVSR